MRACRAAAVAALPPDLPGGMKEILLACLSPDPADRPATAAAMARQLEICLQPRAIRLFRPRPGSLRQAFRKYPVWMIIVAGVLPHLVISIFNTIFNARAIVDQLPKVQQDVFYGQQVIAINGVSYHRRHRLGLRFGWPVLRTVRGLYRRHPPDPQQLPAIRHRSLWLGDYVSWMGLALWTITGLVFPLWLMAVGSSRPEDAKFYVYFFLSQVVCGLIAASQEFFMLTVVAIQGFYPLLIETGRTDDNAVNDLLRLKRRANIYLALAVAAPFLAVMTLALTDMKISIGDGGDADHRHRQLADRLLAERLDSIRRDDANRRARSAARRRPIGPRNARFLLERIALKGSGSFFGPRRSTAKWTPPPKNVPDPLRYATTVVAPKPQRGFVS